MLRIPLGLPWGGSLPKKPDLRNMLYEIWYGTQTPYPIDIRIISDGKRCFVKMITPIEKILEDHAKYGITFEEYSKKYYPEIGKAFTFKIDKKD